jgi:hypothetical protein
MIAYEYYKYDPGKGYELLGSVSERRNDPERISRKSIMELFEKIFGDAFNPQEMAFIPVKIE